MEAFMEAAVKEKGAPVEDVQQPQNFIEPKLEEVDYEEFRVMDYLLQSTKVEVEESTETNNNESPKRNRRKPKHLLDENWVYGEEEDYKRKMVKWSDIGDETEAAVKEKDAPVEDVQQPHNFIEPKLEEIDYEEFHVMDYLLASTKVEVEETTETNNNERPKRNRRKPKHLLDENWDYGEEKEVVEKDCKRKMMKWDDIGDETDHQIPFGLDDPFPDCLVPKQEIIDESYEENQAKSDEEEYEKPGNYRSSNKRAVNECRKCGKRFSSKLAQSRVAEDHAVTHSDLKRYQCMIDGCDFKGGYYTHVVWHIKHHHKDQKIKMEKITLTAEQNEELEKLTKECFPTWQRLTNGSRSELSCQICHRKIIGRHTVSRNFIRRAHSLIHVDFMLYKCNEPGCEFKAKHGINVLNHARHMHPNVVTGKPVKIELTKEQELEIEEVGKKCFPNC